MVQNFYLPAAFIFRQEVIPISGHAIGSSEAHHTTSSRVAVAEVGGAVAVAAANGNSGDQSSVYRIFLARLLVRPL